MIVRETRSVCLTDLSSLVVHLPKTWAKSVGIEKGSRVTVIFGLGDLLLVVPPERDCVADRLIETAGEDA